MAAGAAELRLSREAQSGICAGVTSLENLHHSELLFSRASAPRVSLLNRLLQPLHSAPLFGGLVAGTNLALVSGHLPAASRGALAELSHAGSQLLTLAAPTDSPVRLTGELAILPDEPGKQQISRLLRLLLLFQIPRPGILTPFVVPEFLHLEPWYPWNPQPRELTHLFQVPKPGVHAPFVVPKLTLKPTTTWVGAAISAAAPNQGMALAFSVAPTQLPDYNFSKLVGLGLSLPLSPTTTSYPIAWLGGVSETQPTRVATVDGGDPVQTNVKGLTFRSPTSPVYKEGSLAS